MAQQRYVVRGLVQGVGFRWFVVQEAERLGLAGVARNCRDGSVEVIAEGTPDRLDQLERVLSAGPRSARVDGVEKNNLQHEITLPKPFRAE